MGKKAILNPLKKFLTYLDDCRIGFSEQLTYLIFIRSLDEKELENESFEALSSEAMPKIFPQDENGQAMRWSKFKTKDSRLIYDIVGTKVFPFIKAMNGENASAFSRYMQDAMFLIPTPQVLQKIITGLDELYVIGTIGNPIVVHKTFDFAIKNVALIKFVGN